MYNTLPTVDQQADIGRINLSQLTETYVVLYFYPKDATAGCTTQAVEFSALHAQFAAQNAIVIGVSRDSLASHARFIEKNLLAIPLISDADESLCRYFDVIKEKNMYGKRLLGIERSTFVFKKGVLLEEWRKVKAAGHAQQVLDVIQQDCSVMAACS